MKKNSPNSDILLEVQNLTVQYGELTVLEKISFSLTKGSFIGLIGPNGAGKSTLLRTLLDLEKPTSGTYTFAPKIVKRYVPQQFTLPSHVPISVIEVISMGAYGRIPHEKVHTVLTYVGLDKKFLRRNYHNLSGGQKQRIMIARALIVKPDIIFFDEPLSGVDVASKSYIYKVLKKLNQSGTTIFFVSHDVSQVVDVCDLVLCLDKSLHQGCHPIAFAHGERNLENSDPTMSKCLVGGKITTDKALIHHHHN